MFKLILLHIHDDMESLITEHDAQNYRTCRVINHHGNLCLMYDLVPFQKSPNLNDEDWIPLPIFFLSSVDGLV